MAPHRELSDTHSPRSGFVGELGSFETRAVPQRERSDARDPRRGFVGHVDNLHGAAARANPHARFQQRVRRRAFKFARRRSESDQTRTISLRRLALKSARRRSESDPTHTILADLETRTVLQRERSDTHGPRKFAARRAT